MNREPRRPIDEGEIRRYREDGVIGLRGSFGGDRIAASRPAIRWNARRPRASGRDGRLALECSR
jgi:hypothetical protein